ncbi:thioredoxin family protein [Thermodesulfobacteriota bacterium]
MKGIQRLSILLTVSCLCITLSHGAAFGAGRINLQAVLSKGAPVLLEFGRGWCKPCKYMKPILNDMARMYAGRAIVTTVDMDANTDLVRSFGIRMMPTQVFLQPGGKEFFRNEGTLEREQIAQIFSRMGLAPPRGADAAGVGTPMPRFQSGPRAASR